MCVKCDVKYAPWQMIMLLATDDVRKHQSRFPIRKGTPKGDFNMHFFNLVVFSMPNHALRKGIKMSEFCIFCTRAANLLGQRMTLQSGCHHYIICPTWSQGIWSSPSCQSRNILFKLQGLREMGRRSRILFRKSVQESLSIMDISNTKWTIINSFLDFSYKLQQDERCPWFCIPSGTRPDLIFDQQNPTTLRSTLQFNCKHLARYGPTGRTSNRWFRLRMHKADWTMTQQGLRNLQEWGVSQYHLLWLFFQPFLTESNNSAWELIMTDTYSLVCTGWRRDAKCANLVTSLYTYTCIWCRQSESDWFWWKFDTIQIRLKIGEICTTV